MERPGQEPQGQRRPQARPRLQPLWPQSLALSVPMGAKSLLPVSDGLTAQRQDPRPLPCACSSFSKLLAGRLLHDLGQMGSTLNLRKKRAQFDSPSGPGARSPSWAHRRKDTQRAEDTLGIATVTADPVTADWCHSITVTSSPSSPPHQELPLSPHPPVRAQLLGTCSLLGSCCPLAPGCQLPPRLEVLPAPPSLPPSPAQGPWLLGDSGLLDQARCPSLGDPWHPLGRARHHPPPRKCRAAEGPSEVPQPEPLSWVTQASASQVSSVPRKQRSWRLRALHPTPLAVAAETMEGSSSPGQGKPRTWAALLGREQGGDPPRHFRDHSKNHLPKPRQEPDDWQDPDEPDL